VCTRAGDDLLHDREGRIVGDGFVVERIVRGETMSDVLSRAQHSVSLCPVPRCLM
jgi:hypothetical protein